MGTETSHKPAAPMGPATTTKPATAAPAATAAPSQGRPAGKSNVPAKELALAAEIKVLREKKADTSAKVAELNELQFRRLCVRRVEQVLNMLNSLTSLARLKPSDEYRAKVVKALNEATTALDLAWKGTEVKTGFEL